MGKIEIITGPMFSGKTTELLRRLERYLLAGKEIVYFVPEIDTRTQEYVTIASTRQEQKIKVQRLPLDLTEYNRMWPLVDVVALDEAQFFTKSIIALCQSLKDIGTTVIVSGLDMDYRRMPFGSIGDLMAIANNITKLTAICSCGKEAQYTQRIGAEKELVTIGDYNYVPRCKDCHTNSVVKRNPLDSSVGRIEKSIRGSQNVRKAKFSGVVETYQGKSGFGNSSYR